MDGRLAFPRDWLHLPLLVTGMIALFVWFFVIAESPSSQVT